MEPATVVAIIITVVVLAAAGAIVIPKLLKQRDIDWKLLPGFEGARYVAPDDVQGSFIGLALDQACDVLIDHGPWGGDDVRRVANQLLIVVLAANEWTDEYGRKVAGVAREGNLIQVGKNLAALCHELAHTCERNLDKGTDDDHSTWLQRGIWAADNDFHAWLKEST